MNIIIVVILIWFVIGTFSFHFIMSKKDKENMYKNKISLVVFLALAPITILFITLKTIFKH